MTPEEYANLACDGPEDEWKFLCRLFRRAIAEAYEDAAKIADNCPCDGGVHGSHGCCSQYHAATAIRARKP